MNFFGIGLPEVILILILALIVLGPQRLPEFAAQLARLVRQTRRYAGQVTSQLKYELGDLTKDYEELRQELRELREELRGQAKSVEDEVRTASSELKAASESIEAAATGKEDKPHQAAQSPSPSEEG